MARLFLSIAACSGFLAVAFGAFGAHAVKNQISPELFSVYQTATEYQWFHTFAVFLCGVLMQLDSQVQKLFRNAGWLFIIGTVIFSGSLYALSLTGIRWLGAITPFGGVLLLIAWLFLIVGTVKFKKG